MKIAFVFGKALPYRISFFLKLSRFFDVDFFLESVETTDVLEANLCYECYRSFNVPFLSKYGSYMYGSPSFPVDLAFRLVRKEHDLIVSKGIATFASYISFVLSRLLRKPFVLWDETWYYPKTFARTLAMPFMKTMARNCEAVVVPGSKSKEYFISLGVNPERILIVPNACEMPEVDSKRADDLRKELGIGEKRVVLYFSRLIRRKGCGFLVKAFERLQKEFDDVFLIIAGSGPYKGELKHLCQLLQINSYHFLNYIEEADRAPVYSLADVVVVPSIRTHLIAEIWGIVVNEAMSLAKPVIATDAVGAAYDLIEDGVNGFIVKEKDPNLLYDAIKKILLDSDEAKAIGLRARKTIESEFTLQNMAESFRNAIESVAWEI